MMKKNFIYIFLFWVIITILINPIGNFYYGDDWAYAKPVKHFIETGIIKFTDWSSMTLIFHILWGSMFAKLFGFSATVLRFSMIIMGFLGSISTYYFFKEFTDKQKTIWLSTAFIVLNPIYLIHCFTFFTDITFYTLFISSALFFIKYLKRYDLSSFIIANCFSLLAILTRDVALVLPPAFMITLLLRSGINKKNLLYGSISIIVVLIGFFGFRYWFEHYHGLTANIDFSRNRIKLVFNSGLLYLLKTYVNNIYSTLLYITLSFFPLILFSYWNLIKSKSEKIRLRYIGLTITILLLATAGLYLVPKLYTWNYNLLFNSIYLIYYWFGDIYYPSLSSVFILPQIVANTIFFVGNLGIAMLIAISFNFIKSYNIDLFKKNLKSNGTYLLSFLLFLFYIIPILTQGFTNRYLFLMLPFLIIFFIRLMNEFSFNKLSKALIGIFIISFSYYSVAGTHDILSYLRARTESTDYLENKLNIKPDKIDGGFEYNAWHFYDFNYKPTKEKNFWWVQKDDFIVSWGEIKNKKLINKIEFPRYMPPFGRGYIYTYKNN